MCQRSADDGVVGSTKAIWECIFQRPKEGCSTDKGRGARLAQVKLSMRHETI